MIKLIRPSIPASLEVSRKNAKAAILLAVKNKDNKLPFDSGVYASQEVRDALRAMHQKKCAYCERILPQIRAGHVDHFRPKGAVKQADGSPTIKPGYYWLAYEWKNLFLVCDFCNSHSKRTIFPLLDTAARVTKPNHSLKKESPLLINPAEEDPEIHIKFVAGDIFPRDASEKGEVTINALKLDEPGLTEHRLKTLTWVTAMVKLAYIDDVHPESEEAAEVFRGVAKEVKAGSHEYSGMLRENLKSILDAPPPKKRSKAKKKLASHIPA